MTNKEKFILLRKGIETAKELQDKATEAEDLIFKALDDLGVDSAKHNTAVENASNLLEAISCYIHLLFRKIITYHELKSLLNCSVKNLVSLLKDMEWFDIHFLMQKIQRM